LDLSCLESTGEKCRSRQNWALAQGGAQQTDGSHSESGKILSLDRNEALGVRQERHALSSWEVFERWVQRPHAETDRPAIRPLDYGQPHALVRKRDVLNLELASRPDSGQFLTSFQFPEDDAEPRIDSR